MSSVYRPAPDRIVELFEALAERQPPVLELAWRNPGRRAVEQPQKLEQEQEELEDTKPESSTNHMDFEDDDEDSVPMMMTPTRGRTPGALKGSARKKTTSLQETLANMRRHRIEEKEYNEEKKS